MRFFIYIINAQNAGLCFRRSCCREQMGVYHRTRLPLIECVFRHPINYCTFPLHTRADFVRRNEYTTFASNSQRTIFTVTQLAASRTVAGDISPMKCICHPHFASLRLITVIRKFMGGRRLPNREHFDSIAHASEA